MALFLQKSKKGSMKTRKKGIKGKKADITMSLNEIIGLVMAVAGIFVLIGLIFIASKVLFERPQQGTTEALKEIDEAINLLLAYDEAECYIPIYIDPKHAIVGYDWGEAKPVKTCGRDRELNRPDECGSSACICLCKFDIGSSGEDACQDNFGCYIYPNDKLQMIRTNAEAGESDSLVMFGMECMSFSSIGVKNVVLSKRGPTLKITRVENTMGAEPCVSLKYA